MHERDRDRALPETLYQYVWRATRRHQVGLVLLTAAVFPLSMAPLELQRRIVNDALEGRDAGLLFTLCSVYLTVLLLHGGLKLALRVYRGVVSESTVRGLRQEVYRNDRVRRDETGSALSMLVAEVEPVGGFVGEAICEPLLHIGVLVSIFGYMLFIEPVMALAGIVFCIPQIYLVPRFQKAINRRNELRIQIVRELSGQLADGQDEAREAGEREAFAHIDEIFRLRLRVNLLKFTLKFLNNLLHNLGPLSAFLVGGWLVLEGQTDLGTVVAFASGFERISDPWRELITFYRSASDARVKYRLVADALAT